MAIYATDASGKRVKVAGGGGGTGTGNVPPGGMTGQVLAKASDTDYDTQWTDQTGGGGTAGVSSFNGRTGAVTPQAGDYTAADVGAVPTARTVNGKALSSNITLSAADVSARPDTWTPKAAEVSVTPPDGMTSTNVQGAVSELFTSVSSGKALVASAITDKGVSTASDATFQTMHDNILAIETGGLPQDVYTVDLQVSPENTGTVSGAGVVQKDMTVTVSADPADGYRLKNWQKSNTAVSAENNYTFKVAGNTSLKAVFEEGQVFGRDWTVSNLPVVASWSCVYDGSKYVAVNNKGTGATSADGLTWTAFNLPSVSSKNVSYSNIREIAYYNGVYIIPFYHETSNYTPTKTYLFSKNGTTWQFKSFPVAGIWGQVKVANGKFFAIPSAVIINYEITNSNVLLVSDDGESWQSVTLSSTYTWAPSIAYGNGRYVMLAQTQGTDYHTPQKYTNVVIWSINGLDWHYTTLPKGTIYDKYQYVYVNFFDGHFYISDTDGYFTSSDGNTWVHKEPLFSSVSYTTQLDIYKYAGTYIALPGFSSTVYYGPGFDRMKRITLPENISVLENPTLGSDKVLLIPTNDSRALYSLLQ